MVLRAAAGGGGGGGCAQAPFWARRRPASGTAHDGATNATSAAPTNAQHGAANATSAPSHPPGKKRSSSSNGGGGSSSSNAANSTAAATVANALKTCPACGEINPLARLSCRLCAAKFSVRQTSELLQQPSRPMIGASGEVRYGARDGP